MLKIYSKAQVNQIYDVFKNFFVGSVSFYFKVEINWVETSGRCKKWEKAFKYLFSLLIKSFYDWNEANNFSFYSSFYNDFTNFVYDLIFLLSNTVMCHIYKSNNLLFKYNIEINWGEILHFICFKAFKVFFYNS